MVDIVSARPDSYRRPARRSLLLEAGRRLRWPPADWLSPPGLQEQKLSP